MSKPIHAYAALKRGEPLQPFDCDPGDLQPQQVEIEVEHCGICHSDLSMLDNDWSRTRYPFVPGHEVVGKITALGSEAKGLKVGQRVGLGWMSGSCLHCRPCLSGDHNLCLHGQETIVGRQGGFADRVRCDWIWASPLPDNLDATTAGPLFCGGITVFNPIVQLGVKPTDRVGVIGIGGLGHLALQFLNKWGCEVIAFSSNDSKRDESIRLGAHQVINSRDASAFQKLKGTLDFILVTTNVGLNWSAYLETLRPKGKLHFVGAVLDPLKLSVFELLPAQKSVSGSPLGSPTTVADMLEFCARHKIAPMVEFYPMDQVNDALEHLRAGKARYRIILKR